MSEMPPRKYLWQLADFNNMDPSLLWEETDEGLTSKADELIPQVDSSLLNSNILNNSFDQTGPSETEYEI